MVYSTYIRNIFIKKRILLNNLGELPSHIKSKCDKYIWLFFCIYTYIMLPGCANVNYIFDLI